jgi:hypothetical protein
MPREDRVTGRLAKLEAQAFSECSQRRPRRRSCVLRTLSALAGSIPAWPDSHAAGADMHGDAGAARREVRLGPIHTQ